MMLTPSLLLDTKYVDAQVAVQGFDVNTNTNKEDDDHIRGYNVRGTARAEAARRPARPVRERRLHAQRHARRERPLRSARPIATRR